MNEIEGPLGVWPWPILNTIIAVAEARSEDEKELIVNRDGSGEVQSVSIEEIQND